MSEKIIFIGCGKMGSALMNNWVQSGAVVQQDIMILEADETLLKKYTKQGFECFGCPVQVPAGTKAKLIVYAVKPHMLGDALAMTQHLIGKKTLVLCIAAGKTLGFISEHCPKNQPIVRIMPNMCVEVSLGVTGMIGNAFVNKTQKSFMDKLMLESGMAFWVVKEDDLHSVTAVSGSSPAYFYNAAIVLAQAAQKYGFDEKTANQMSVNVLLGSVLLFANSAGSLPDAISRIATPKGTTQAAVDTFNKNDALLKLFEKAMAACVKRSKELAK